jgi:amino acid adenylation domain-containing protein
VKQRLHELLTVQAERRPQAVAAVFQDVPTTYAALEQMSNRLARTLRAAGCRKGDRIALLLTKSTRALVAIFGSLKADCIYVPIDTNSPIARIQRILQKCECRCILAEQATAGLLNELIDNGAVTDPSFVAWLDSGVPLAPGARSQFNWSDVESLPDGPPESIAQPNDPAHILFTSGSTGVPKGVVITHANVIHFVRWAGVYFKMNSEDRISGHPPLHFDLSTFDIYGTVAAGAQIHLMTPETSLLPHKLAAFIRDKELTQWFSVPWVLQQMAKFDAVRQNDFPALKRLLWCGEKFPTPALIYWMKRLPHVTFDNLYGPTEATIASSYYRVARCPDDETAEVPIGLPCKGELMLVLDEQLRPVRPGETGDLYIGGVGLSPGYWNDPERTQEVFRPNPYSSNPSDRIYNTGDLARIGAEGMVYLIGRSDSQIKSRGYRIELGEIEAAVHVIPGVQDAAVVVVDSSESEDKTICCAYVSRTGVDLSPLVLKRQLAAALPRYMMPQRWMALEQMPRNGNGKTDRPFLRQQFQQAASAAAQEMDGAAESLGTDQPRKSLSLVQ